jgi:hypothetical protein
VLVGNEPGCSLLDLNAEVSLEELGEKIDEVSEAIPIPDACAYVAITPDEFAGTTIESILHEVLKQPRNCTEFSRWATAVSILIAYVSTKLCSK